MSDYELPWQKRIKQGKHRMFFELELLVSKPELHTTAIVSLIPLRKYCIPYKTIKNLEDNGRGRGDVIRPDRINGSMRYQTLEECRCSPITDTQPVWECSPGVETETKVAQPYQTKRPEFSTPFIPKKQMIHVFKMRIAKAAKSSNIHSPID